MSKKPRSKRARANMPTRPQQASSAQGENANTIDASSGTARAYQQVLAMQEHQGPIPTPQMLEAYDRLLPGAAERIIQWAEEDLRHSRSMERELMGVVSRERKRGQVCAVVVCVAAFVTAGFCAYVGAVTAAAVIGGTTVVGLVVAFLGGRNASERQ